MAGHGLHLVDTLLQRLLLGKIQTSAIAESCWYENAFPRTNRNATTTSAHKSTHEGDMAASNATISPSATSFAIPMRPGHATPVTAQALNTPELLDLILSNLRLKDILFRAELTCRGFRNMIATSPSIEGILAMTKLLATSLYPTSRTCYSQTIFADRKHSGGCLLYLTFASLDIERLLSLRSFRNLYLPEDGMKKAMWWMERPGNDSMMVGQLSPAYLDARIVTVAGLLKIVVERERGTKTRYGYE
jgi:hypothetical protein